MARSPLIIALLVLTALCHLGAGVSIASATSALFPEAALHLTGLFVLLVGIVVWWRHPRDPAAPPLLVLTMALSLLGLLAPPHDRVGRLLSAGRLAIILLAGYAATALAVAFAGWGPRLAKGGWMRVLLVVSVVLALALAATGTYDGVEWALPAVQAAAVAQLLCCLGAIAAVTWLSSRPTSATVLRRRSRLLGRAGLVALLVATSPLWAPVVGWQVGPAWAVALQAVPVGLFVLIVGLAISGRACSDALYWAFGGRATAAGLARVGEGLVRARRLEEVGAAVHEELVHRAGLERCRLVVPEGPDAAALRCVSPAAESGGASPAQPLPARFAAQEFAPIARALAARRPALAADPQAMEAQSRALTAELRDRRGEGLFWTHYGVEAVVPLVGAGEALVGLMVLGPRRGGRRLGAAQMALLRPLTRIVAAAIEGVATIERLEHQASGLARQVADGEQELAGTRTRLRDVYEELVDAEMQALLGRLVAGIVHEANTPLGTFRSSLDTLSRAIAKYRPFVAERAAAEEPGASQALRAVDAQSRMIEVMETSRQRLSNLIESLKRFIGLDAAEVKTVDVCQAIDDVVTLVGARLADGVRVIRSYAEPAPRVRCSPARLSQVFLNLVQNATEAIAGPGEIEIVVSREEGRVVVAVRDSGRGIPAAKLDGILEFAFTMKAEGRVGLRMGLPACKKIVVEMGGSVSITSTEGEGTTVRVELPGAEGG